MTYEKFSSFLLLDTGPNTPGTTENHPTTIKGIQPWDAGAGRAVTWKTPHSNDMAEHCCISHSSCLYLRTPSHGSQKLPYYSSQLSQVFCYLQLEMCAQSQIVSSCLTLSLGLAPAHPSSPPLKSLFVTFLRQRHFTGHTSCQSPHLILSRLLQNPWDSRNLWFMDRSLFPQTGMQVP